MLIFCINAVNYALLTDCAHFYQFVNVMHNIIAMYIMHVLISVQSVYICTSYVSNLEVYLKYLSVKQSVCNNMSNALQGTSTPSPPGNDKPLCIQTQR